MKPPIGVAMSLVVISCALLFTAGIHDEHDWGDDFAAYIMQARSLVEGNSSALLADNRFRIEHSSLSGLGPIAYPWGYPVLLAPLYAWFGVQLAVFKSINVLCYLGFVALLAYAWPHVLPDIWRIVFVALFAWNPYFQDFMNQVLSDIPFLLVSTVAILLLQRVIVEQRWLISQTMDLLLLGFVIALAYFIRANEALLLGTLVVAQFIRAMQHTPSSSLLQPALPYLSFGLTAVLWRIVTPEWGYSFALTGSQISLTQIAEHAHNYIDLPAEFFTGVPHRELIYGASIPFAIIGMLRRRGSDYPMILYGALTLVLFIVWPHAQGLRFLFPILPFYLHFVLLGLREAGFLFGECRSALFTFLRVSPTVVILYCFADTSVAYAITNQRESRPEIDGPYLSASQQMFSHISQHTDPHSVIVFFKPRAMQFFAKRRAIRVTDPNLLRWGDYLCLYVRMDGQKQVSGRDIARLREDGQLSLVYQNEDFQVFRMNTSASMR